MNDKTIFVSIGSIEDYEVVETIRCAFESAKNPDRVFVGLHLLDFKKDIYKKVLEVKKIYPNIRVSYEKLSVKSISQLGSGRGRFKAQSHYVGEDYFLQIDAHTWLKPGWDSYLIDLLEEAKVATGNEKTLITRIPGYFEYIDYGVKRMIEPPDLHPYTSFKKLEQYLGTVPKWGQFPFDQSLYSDKFYPATKICSACVFGDAQFAEDTGVRENVIFYEEDLIAGMELYGRGFSFAFPNVMDFPVDHLNAMQVNQFSGKRSFFADLLPKHLNDRITSTIKANYTSYITNKDNAEKVSMYEAYANIKAKYGSSVDCYVPPKYRIDK